jgi:hypothetical protein
MAQLIEGWLVLAQSGGGYGAEVCVCIGVGLVLLLGVAAAANNRCAICETPIKKTSYAWKIDGKRQKLCPNCNRQMESRQSKAAFRRKFG